MIDSVVRVWPLTPSIIAAEISLDAMMAYCGEVEGCIMNDSLKRLCSMALRPSRTWMKRLAIGCQ